MWYISNVLQIAHAEPYPERSGQWERFHPWPACSRRAWACFCSSVSRSPACWSSEVCINKREHSSIRFITRVWNEKEQNKTDRGHTPIVRTLQQLLDLVVFVDSGVDLGGELWSAGTLGVGFEESLSLMHFGGLLRFDPTDGGGDVLIIKWNKVYIWYLRWEESVCFALNWEFSEFPSWFSSWISCNRSVSPWCQWGMLF